MEAAGETYTEATAGTTTATTETETSGSEKGTGEEASLGDSGSSGAEWSGGNINAHSFSDDRRYTGRFNVAN